MSQARIQKQKGGVSSVSSSTSSSTHPWLVSILLLLLSIDMTPFIISVPVLVFFFGLLSCAAPLAGPPPTAPSTAPFPNERALVMGYYPDWASYSLPPEKIEFGRFDWIDFAFALPDQSFALTWDDPVNAPALLHRLVSAAHQAGTHVKLSIGGWTGSQLR